MQVTKRQQAGEHERYAPDAFDAQVGRTLPLKLGMDGPPVDTAVVVSAVVVDDGRAVDIVFEIPEESLAARLLNGEIWIGCAWPGPRGPYTPEKIVDMVAPPLAEGAGSP